MPEKLDTVLGYLKEFPDYYKYVTKKTYTLNEKLFLKMKKRKVSFLSWKVMLQLN